MLILSQPVETCGNIYEVHIICSSFGWGISHVTIHISLTRETCCIYSSLHMEWVITYVWSHVHHITTNNYQELIMAIPSFWSRFKSGVHCVVDMCNGCWPIVYHAGETFKYIHKIHRRSYNPPMTSSSSRHTGDHQEVDNITSNIW